MAKLDLITVEIRERKLTPKPKEKKKGLQSMHIVFPRYKNLIADDTKQSTNCASKLLNITKRNTKTHCLTHSFKYIPYY